MTFEGNKYTIKLLPSKVLVTNTNLCVCVCW